MKGYKQLLQLNTAQDGFSQLIRRNIAGGMLAKGISIGINFIYVPLLINYLNAERYGIWIAITSFISWFQYFDIGIGNGLRNHLTQALSQNDHKMAKELVSTSYLLTACIFSTLALLFFLLSHSINWPGFLNIYSISQEELRALFLIVFTGLSITFITQLIQPVLFATQHAAFSAAFPAISNLVSLSFLLVAMRTDASPLLTAGIILSSAPLLTFSVGSFFLFSGKLRHISPSFRHVRFSLSSKITGLGFRFFFIQVANVIISSSASLIIIRIFGPEDVTSYNIAFKYLQISTVLSGIIATPLWSGFTKKLAEGDHDWIRKTIRKQNKISLLLSCGVVALTLLSPVLIPLWIGKSVAVQLPLIALLALYFIQTVFATVYSMFINGSGKIRLSMYFTGIEITAYILLAHFLSLSPMGVYGVVVAGIVTKFASFLLQYTQTNKILNHTASGIWNK